jgi:hypothetical protein
VRSEPADGARDVPLDVGTLRLHFDQDMQDGHTLWGSERGQVPPLPEPEAARWRTPRLFEIPLGPLQPNATYAIQLNSARRRRFRSAAGEPLPITTIVFRTGGGAPAPEPEEVIVVPPPPAPTGDDVIVVPPPPEPSPPPAKPARTRFRRTEQRLGAVAGTFPRVLAAASGCRYAYVEEEDGKQRLVVDGTPGPWFAELDKYKFEFGDDGSRFAYWAKAEGGECIVLNHRPGPRFDKVLSLPDRPYHEVTFRLDATRVAYAAKKDGQTYVLVNDQRHGPHPVALMPALGPDGRLAYGGSRTGKPPLKPFFMVDGEPQEVSYLPLFVYFSPDGKRLACLGAAIDPDKGLPRDKPVVVLDGVVSPGYDDASTLMFSADSRHFAYEAKRDGREFVVLDGQEQKDYDEVADLEFSPDGRRFAYKAWEKSSGKYRKCMAVIDGRPSRVYGSVDFIEFSPDGKHVVFVAQPFHATEYVENREFVVLDGVEQAECEEALYVEFSADSQHSIYTGKRDGRYHVFVDGEAVASSRDRLVGAALSADGSHAAWYAQPEGSRMVYLDEEADPAFDEILTGPVFRSDGAMEYLGVRDGIAYRVVHAPVPPRAEGPAPSDEPVLVVPPPEPAGTKDAAAWYKKAQDAADAAEKFTCYRKAAEAGHADAMFSVGVCYRQGQGVEQDDAKAAAWYRRAAEKGQGEAAFNLGSSYANGRGVEKDEREALKWYLVAAKKGSDRAMFSVGLCYARGSGVAKDAAKALDWFRKAAAKGYAAGAYNAGLMLEHGVGAPTNVPEAIRYYRQAAKGGHEQAIEALARLEAKEPAATP